MLYTIATASIFTDSDNVVTCLVTVMIMVGLIGFGGFGWFSVLLVVLVLVLVTLVSVTPQTALLCYLLKVCLCFSSCKCVVLFCSFCFRSD